MQQEEKELTIENGYPVIRRPFKRAELESLPIANDQMTEDELREICVRYALMETSIPWTPSRDLVYPCPTAKGADKYGNITCLKGNLYVGIPYTHAGRDYSNFLDFIDEETGVLQVDKLGEHPEKVIGNNCATSVFWGWARVTGSLSYSLTRFMMPSHGCTKLGTYEYDMSIKDFADFGTKKICTNNGEQVMFESYALAKKADGVVKNNGAGHAMMVMEDAVAVRNEDGTINGEESYLYVVEQFSVRSVTETEDGAAERVGAVRNKKTFLDLYKDGNIVFRIPELAGLLPVQKAWVKHTFPEGELTLPDLAMARVYANYAISRVDLSLSANGKELHHAVGYGRVWEENRSFSLMELDLPETLSEPAADVKIAVRLGNGESFTAYEGKVIASCEIPKISHPITKYDVDALLPVANDEMTEDELRDLCVRYAVLQASMPWTLSQTAYYLCASAPTADKNGNIRLPAGRLYGGLPYTHAGHDLYNFLDYCDASTGVLDTERLGLGMGRILGNNCASAMYWAWGRISSHVRYSYTGTMLPARGCLKLGPYEYDTTIPNFNQFGTRKICKANGEQVMFESYALMKKGDGFVLSNDNHGHASMAMEDAVTVRNEDGTINGDESYVVIVEQHAPLTLRESEDGPVYNVGGVGNQLSFNKLFQLSDIPFRVPELAGLMKVSKASFAFTLEVVGAPTYAQLGDAKLACNYPISQVWLTVKDRTGKTHTFTGYGTVADANVFPLNRLNLPQSLPAGKLTITARAGNGDVQTVYEKYLLK